MSFHDVSNSYGRKGQPRIKAVCCSCERAEVISCPRGAEGQAIKKIQEMGWSLIKKALRCPMCEAKRKAENMVQKSKAPAPLRQPTRAQIREINSMLDDVYDVKDERYQRGDTDETVAEVLGVMPGWVVAERERAFGPAGGNEELDALAVKVVHLGHKINRAIIDSLERYKIADAAYELLQKSHANFDKTQKDIEKFHETLRELGKTRNETTDSLAKLQKAVGSRVMAKAK